MTSETSPEESTQKMEDWLEKTAAHFAHFESGPDTFGVVSLLYNQCLVTLRTLFPVVERNYNVFHENPSRSTSLKSWKEMYGSLFLWGESVRDGLLDDILGDSDTLRITVAELLIKIGSTLAKS